MFDPPPPTHSAVRFYRVRFAEDGTTTDEPCGELRRVGDVLTATGLGDSILRTARRRLWYDDRILRFYATWTTATCTAAW